MHTVWVAALVLAAALLAACSAGNDDAGAVRATSTTSAASAPRTTSTTAVRFDAAGAVVGAHDCVVGDPAAVHVAWDRLRNPIFATDHMTKDETVRVVDGRWYLAFSERFEPGDERPPAGPVWSDDLRTWHRIASAGALDSGSPDFTRARDGRFVVTQQIRDPRNPDISKPYYRTATTLRGPWSSPRRLVPSMFPSERMIDGALAHTRIGLVLMFKRGLHTSLDQHVEVAWSESGSLDGPWRLVGEPNLGRAENFEFLVIDGVWHVLATAIPIHVPVLYRLDGDPGHVRSWLRWTKVAELDVPQEAWNRGRVAGIDHETANSAYLCDARRTDGYWYLFYAGSNELKTFEGRGHAKIGVARSRDLRTWRVPPG